MFGTQQSNYIQQTIDCFHGKKIQRKIKIKIWVLKSKQTICALWTIKWIMKWISPH
jgi:hypothetical protein